MCARTHFQSIARNNRKGCREGGYRKNAIVDARQEQRCIQGTCSRFLLCLTVETMHFLRANVCRARNAMTLGICSCKASGGNLSWKFWALSSSVSWGQRNSKISPEISRHFSWRLPGVSSGEIFHGSTSAKFAETTFWNVSKPVWHLCCMEAVPDRTWVHQNRVILCGCGGDSYRSRKNCDFLRPQDARFLCEENR